ncbi:MAG TPA: hypothetical protein VJ848_11780 [Candidatus Angelobacter sp.]|nr:hypothetical protein [Candidatus Angelobacter sp.]
MSSLSPAFAEQKIEKSLSSKLLLTAVLAPLLLAGAMQLGKAARSVAASGDNTYPESAVVQTAIWAKTSGRIYPSLDSSPYTPAPYGPLFYLALTGLAKLGKLNFDSLLVAGRVVSLTFYMLIVIAAYLWERRHLQSTLALLAPALILAQVDFVDWIVTVRPDLGALTLTMGALMLISSQRPSWKKIAVAGLLCGFSGVIKQSYIALPLATVWLLWSRRFKWAFVFVGATAVAGGSVFGFLALKHEPFLNEMLLARYSPLSFTAAVQLLKADMVQYPLQMVVLGLALLGLRDLPAGGDFNIRRFMALYFGLAWLMGFYTAMAPGASTNAFLESWILSALLAPLAFARVAKYWPTVPVGVRGLLLVLWLSIVIVTLDRWRVIFTGPHAGMQKLAQLAKGRRVLTDFPYVAAHSLQPEMLDPSVNHYLELGGHWSSQPVLNELRTGRFDYVIIGESNGAPRSWRGLTLFSGSILREVEQDYRPLCQADRFIIYARPGAQFDTESNLALLKGSGCKQISR